MYKHLKPYTIARFEPTIFCSGGGDDDHYILLKIIDFNIKTCFRPDCISACSDYPKSIKNQPVLSTYPLNMYTHIELHQWYLLNK
jgi:hypothetical protein